MQVTRSTTGSTPAEDVTHVLHWVPPYMARDRRGRWELQALADYEAAATASAGSIDAPRGVDPGELAAWAATQVGYRVDIDLAWAEFAAVTARPPFLQGAREPVFYVRAADYTSPEVLQASAGGADWADPADPALIDWPARQAAAAIWFDVADGYPVSPFGTARVLRGRNELGRWGEGLAADAIVLSTYAGFRWLLMIWRADGYGCAVPGGMTEPGETGPEAAVRELAEETGLAQPLSACQPLPARHVPDPRESGQAWIVTIPVLIDLGMVDRLPAVAGGDDAARAEWVVARDYAALEQSLELDHNGAKVFAAHTQMLRELLDGPAYSACEALFASGAPITLDGANREMTVTAGDGSGLFTLAQHNTPPWGRCYRLFPEGTDRGIAVISPGDITTAVGVRPSDVTRALLGAAPAGVLAVPAVR
jgi:ADP-ribose pyrophosphatase YjhB (NUDIX family)